MELKTKKSLSLASFLILIFGGLFLPIHQTQAIVPLVGAGIAATVVYVGGWIIQAVSMLSAAGVTMWAAILQWVLRLDWPYTSGGIVAIGWPLVRDLTNIAFVIILVAIGLATALRIEGYQAKITLRNLVLIILLVNFTPVIAGLIVDASNVVMNFFVEEIDLGAYFGAHLSVQHSILPASIWEALNPFKATEHLLGSLVIIIVDLVVQFIFMLFATLFLVRYIAIWILVILSPIAFASYILPATRGTWKMWWNQFLQWCIIGATAGFFLYLGTMLLSKLDEIIPPSNQGFTGPTDLLINLMPLITVALFFVIGLFVSLSTSAMGAKGIASSFKKGGKAAGKVAGFAAAGAAWKVAKSIPAGNKAAGQAWKIHRGLGHGWRQSAGAALERAGAAVRLETTGELRPKAMAKVVAKGVWGTIKGSAIAGVTSTLGIKSKRKGRRKKPCEACGYGSRADEFIGANADRCPRCRAEF